MRIIPFNMLKTTIKTTKIQWKTQKIDTERRREGGEQKKLKEPEKMNRGGGVSVLYCRFTDGT